MNIGKKSEKMLAEAVRTLKILGIIALIVVAVMYQALANHSLIAGLIIGCFIVFCFFAMIAAVTESIGKILRGK